MNFTPSLNHPHASNIYLTLTLMIHLFKCIHFTTSPTHTHTHTQRKRDRQKLHVCIFLFSTHRSVRLTAFFGGMWSWLAFYSSHYALALFIYYCLFISFFALQWTLLNQHFKLIKSHIIYNIIVWNTTKKFKSTLYVYKNKNKKTSEETKPSKQMMWTILCVNVIAL